MASVNDPVFRAVATSTRPLHRLLRCINFAPRAHVQLTEDGIRFSADHARVMQGTVLLDKDLFTAYSVNLPQSDEGEETAISPQFQISMSSFLEVLQIFGAMDMANRAQKSEQDSYRSNLRNYRPDAFSHQILGISGTCTLLYSRQGDPFRVTIEESGVKTTAGLTTYFSEVPDSIPFDPTDLAFKIIMQSHLLLDSLSELSPTAPEKVTITASRSSPYLSLAGATDLGSVEVDFARARDLFETFLATDRWSESFKFDFIKNSSEAMRIASKISLRGDGQGVLNMQFMVELEGSKKGFLDFRFVPSFSPGDGDNDATDVGEKD